LWRGPPLADFAFEDFAQGEIRRLAELRLDALEARLDADLEAGAGGELVGELEQLVTDFPLRERLRWQLMLALYRAGRQAEAPQVYLDGRRPLVDELGIEPSRGLQQLSGSILRQEPVLRADRAEPQEDHQAEVLRAMLAGRLVVVLGGSVNSSGDGGLPGMTDIPGVLARRFACSDHPGLASESPA